MRRDKIPSQEFIASEEAKKLGAAIRNSYAHNRKSPPKAQGSRI